MSQCQFKYVFSAAHPDVWCARDTPKQRLWKTNPTNWVMEGRTVNFQVVCEHALKHPSCHPLTDYFNRILYNWSAPNLTASSVTLEVQYATVCWFHSPRFRLALLIHVMVIFYFGRFLLYLCSVLWLAPCEVSIAILNKKICKNSI